MSDTEFLLVFSLEKNLLFFVFVFDEINEGLLGVWLDQDFYLETFIS